MQRANTFKPRQMPPLVVQSSGKRLLPSHQPGPSKHVLPPATESSPVTLQTRLSDPLGQNSSAYISDSDPLGDAMDLLDEEFALYDILDEANAEESATVAVEELKEEEYELEEYVVLDPSESADAVPQPKRVRFNVADQTAPATAHSSVTSASTMSSSARSANTSQVNTPSGTSYTQRSQVRVVPTERLRKPPNAVANPPAAAAVSPNNVTVLPYNSVRVQYPTLVRATTPAAGAQQPLKNGQFLPLNAPGMKQLQVKVVPLSTLNNSQRMQLKEPLTPITSKVKENQRAATSGSKTSVAATVPQKTVTSNPLKLVTVPLAQNPTANLRPMISSLSPASSYSLARSLAANPLATKADLNVVPVVSNSTGQPTVVRLNNNSLTIRKVGTVLDEPDEKCTIDLAAIGARALKEEDPLATGSEQPTLTASQPISAPRTMARIIPMLQPFTTMTPSDPLTGRATLPTIVKLANSSLTVTRIENNKKVGTPQTISIVAVPGPPQVEVDPLATGTVPPLLPISNTISVTRPPNVIQARLDAGVSTSGIKPRPPVQLDKPTLSIRRIETATVPTKNATTAKPAVRTVPQQRPISNGPQTRSPGGSGTPINKPCNCRSEIARRLKLLDERTRQMESYMNSLIDLIQPNNDFTVKPVGSRDALERLNYDLGSRPQFLQKVKTWISREINGHSAQQRMEETMNLIFAKDFLLQCSWKNPDKITLYSYTYIIELFRFAGSTNEAKPSSVACVGNFFMREIRSMLKKQENQNVSQDVTEAPTASTDNEPNGEEEGAGQTDETGSKSSGGKSAPPLVGTVGPVVPTDTEVSTPTVVEEEDITTYEVVEYLEDDGDDDDEEIVYEIDSQENMSDL